MRFPQYKKSIAVQKGTEDEIIFNIKKMAIPSVLAFLDEPRENLHTPRELTYIYKYFKDKGELQSLIDSLKVLNTLEWEESDEIFQLKFSEKEKK